jgi:hypothetical protein
LALGNPKKANKKSNQRPIIKNMMLIPQAKINMRLSTNILKAKMNIETNLMGQITIINLYIIPEWRIKHWNIIVVNKLLRFKTGIKVKLERFIDKDKRYLMLIIKVL